MEAKLQTTMGVEELILQYAVQIWRLALRLTGSREQAVEITQQVFMQIHQMPFLHIPQERLLPLLYQRTIDTAKEVSP